MTEPHRIGVYYFLDMRVDELVVVPALADIREETRAVISSRSEPGSAVLAVIPPAGRARIALNALTPLSARSIKLQRRFREGWVDHIPYTPLRRLGELVTDNISPVDWGVEEDSIAVLRDPGSREVVMRRFIPARGRVTRTHDAAEDQKLLLEFHRAMDDKIGLGQRIGPSLRWVPSRLRGDAPKEVSRDPDGMSYSCRREVTLAPRVLRRAGHSELMTEGFLGAWAAGEPVVEAMDFVMGRQEMVFQPRPRPPTSKLAGTAIYLGRPHSSWGHFLTQGLARVWFALRNPELPVVWDSPRALPAQQQHVLEMLGLRNQQRFLTEPTEWEEVIFPFPGVCIGDFVHPGYTKAIGSVSCADQVAGKRLFLSRSCTSNFPGGVEREIDELAERHGFTVFRPEQHSIEDQLAEISSAEVVMAVEGSSLHTPLLLRDPIETRFWALSRHRRGSGLFEHVRAVKGLNYQTLNFLRSRARRARDPIDIDIEVLDRALRKTKGLTTNLELLEPHLEHPWQAQTSYETHLRHTQVRSGRFEEKLYEAQLALAAGDLAGLNKLLSAL